MSVRRIKVSVSLTEKQLDALLNIACGGALASERPRSERQLWHRLFQAARKAAHEDARAQLRGEG